MTTINMGQYPKIAELLVNLLETDSLPDPVLEEIGTAQADLLWPIKEVILAKGESSRGLIKKLIKSKNEYERLVGAKLAGTGQVKEDDELYAILKKSFELIDAKDERKYEIKITFAFSLFFFNAYDKDRYIQKALEEYFGKTVGQLAKIITRYYGGVENTGIIFRKALADCSKQTCK